jgi:hypothetical protein
VEPWSANLAAFQRWARVIGSTYLLRVVPVVVLARWGSVRPPTLIDQHVTIHRPMLGTRTGTAAFEDEDWRRGSPRNVLVEFPGARMLEVGITSGARVVRPFRGLRVER